jgi:hypothetical protein
MRVFLSKLLEADFNLRDELSSIIIDELLNILFDLLDNLNSNSNVILQVNLFERLVR